MPRRSLMLAGGGLKIAFQAGVLEVLLDEAGLEFDHADAVSAACFNLAMWTQGMSGQRIADNWRNLDPVSVLDTHLAIGPKLLEAEGLFDLDKFRTKAFPEWGLDFEAIRNSRREATFNAYNFSTHELRAINQTELTEDYLVACASLPVWFPPVRIGGDTWIDAIFNLPCNIDEAVRRGAEEIWVIWTISQRGEWLNGAVNNFFGIFEATTNFAYKQALERVPAGVVVREIKAEVPVHYLLNFSRDRAAEAVNRGVEFAREWCAGNGFTAASRTQSARQPHPGLRFAELARGRVDGNEMEVDVEVHIDDLDRFLSDPHHEASLTGHVRCPAIGGDLPIIAGTYNLFVDDGDPGRKKVTYHMEFGPNCVLNGEKDLRGDPRSDPATVRVELLRKNVAAQSGTLTVGAVDFLKHLASFRSEAATAGQKAADLKRFGAFYLGRLWDVYARAVLPVAPF